MIWNNANCFSEFEILSVSQFMNAAALFASAWVELAPRPYFDLIFCSSCSRSQNAPHTQPDCHLLDSKAQRGWQGSPNQYLFRLVSMSYQLIYSSLLPSHQQPYILQRSTVLRTQLWYRNQLHAAWRYEASLYATWRTTHHPWHCLVQ